MYNYYMMQQQQRQNPQGAQNLGINAQQQGNFNPALMQNMQNMQNLQGMQPQNMQAFGQFNTNAYPMNSNVQGQKAGQFGQAQNQIGGVNPMQMGGIPNISHLPPHAQQQYLQMYKMNQMKQMQQGNQLAPGSQGMQQRQMVTNQYGMPQGNTGNMQSNQTFMSQGSQPGSGNNMRGQNNQPQPNPNDSINSDLSAFSTSTATSGGFNNFMGMGAQNNFDQSQNNRTNPSNEKKNGISRIFIIS